MALYTFQNRQGNISLAELDSNFATINAATATSVTVTGNTQPNITSVGTLSTLSVSGATLTGSIRTDVYAYANGAPINLTGLYGNANVETYLPTYTGTLNQLQSVRADLISADTMNSGQLLLANQVTVSGRVVSGQGFTGDGSGLSNLAAGNIVGTVTLASRALTADQTSVAQTVTTAAQPNITSVGTLSSLAVSGSITSSSVSAATLTGALTTAAQPNITSVGTLSSLAVSGSITSSSVSAATLTGVLTTAAQPNITSVGTLSSLAVSGAVSATTLSGTMTTGSQPSITSVGTLTDLAVSGVITAGSVSAATLTGTLSSAPQPGITAVGNLSALTVSGNTVSDNVSVTGSVVTAEIRTDSYRYANGVPLDLGGEYSNANVAAYLPVYNGNVLALTILSQTADIVGNVLAGNVFTDNYRYANGVPLSLGNVSWNSITGKPTFATVATSGSYNDLSDRPSLATVATSGSYNDLSDRPVVPDIGNIEFENNTIDSNDGNTIVFTPPVSFSDNVSVADSLTTANLTVTGNLDIQGSGDPELVSSTVLSLTAGTRVEITSSPFKIASYTTTQRNTLTAGNGDMIYNSSTNKFQGYANGNWVDLH